MAVLLGSCASESGNENTENQKEEELRIVSLNGTLTEILCALGLEKNIVGTDMTSTYPPSMKKLPKLGYNKSISAEGVLSLKPDIILGKNGDLMNGFESQIGSTSGKLYLFDQTFSLEGTKRLIRQLSDSIGKSEEGSALLKKMEQSGGLPEKIQPQPTVLFVYARGHGALSVSGTGTPFHEIIELAGAKNAIDVFDGFKPLTTESLIEIDPDIILFFDDGLASIGGVEGALTIPGVSSIKAGKNKSIISMDGIFLAGFGPRVIEAARELNGKILNSISND